MVFISLSLHFLGCDDSTSSGNDPQNYEEALADLQKVANSVENLSIEKVDKDAQSRNRDLIFIDDTSDEYTEIFTMIDEETGLKYYDTTKYYNITTNELLKVKEAYEYDSVKSVFSYFMEDPTKKGHWTGTMFEYSSFTTMEDYSYSMSATYTGYIDYFVDQLRLEFSEVTMVSDDSKFEYSYLFTFMDGKYRVEIEGSLNIEDLLDENAVIEILSGPIYNTSNEKVGTFKVYSDDSVKILDKDGNVIKKAS